MACFLEGTRLTTEGKENNVNETKIYVQYFCEPDLNLARVKGPSSVSSVSSVVSFGVRD